MRAFHAPTRSGVSARKVVWSRRFKSEEIDIRPWRRKILAMALRWRGRGIALGVIYAFRTDRKRLWFPSFWEFSNHSSAEGASQEAGSQGNEERISNADIHRDCEKRTACCVSHMKQSIASRLRCSASIARLHAASRLSGCWLIPDVRMVGQSLLRINLIKTQWNSCAISRCL